MKHFRLWLLLLLAVLLPVRGAVAAAMFCPPAAAGTHSEFLVADEAMGQHTMASATAESAAHEHAVRDHGSAADDESLGTHDNCNLCSAFCSATPFVGSLPTMPTLQDVAATAFPDLLAPPPSFLSDGQERPPRSI